MPSELPWGLSTYERRRANFSCMASTSVSSVNLIIGHTGVTAVGAIMLGHTLFSTLGTHE